MTLSMQNRLPNEYVHLRYACVRRSVQVEQTLLEQLCAGSGLNIINQPNNAVSTAVISSSSKQRNKS